MDRVTLLTGDCLHIMPTLAAESFDSLVTDPPYGLGFMGKDWDHGVPGVAFWDAALRVAKPGAYLLAFGSTRTFHRLACAIEDSGWEIRDTIMWVYGSGFPKSLDVSKAIDRAAGAEREVVDDNPRNNITAPATPDAARWQGWGTALKPAWEPIIVARKPVGETVAANVLRWGTGALNVDACRVGTESTIRRQHDGPTWSGKYKGGDKLNGSASGRWPANVIHDGSDEALAGFPVTTSGKPSGKRQVAGFATAVEHGTELTGFGDTGSAARFFACCPPDADEMPDAARYVYCAKASKRDRDEGCAGLEEHEPHWRENGLIEDRTWIDRKDGKGPVKVNARMQPRRNHHPTVKPSVLMRYLVRLVTPTGGIVLDPFMGSGSTGKAAMAEGFAFTGIDNDAEYVEIAKRRIAAVQQPLSAV